MPLIPVPNLVHLLLYNHVTSIVGGIHFQRVTDRPKYFHSKTAFALFVFQKYV